MAVSGSTSSRMKVLLGSMEMGRGAMADKDLVGYEVQVASAVFMWCILCLQCYDTMDAFLSTGHREIDTAYL